jgi:hypothetical protein
MHRLKYALAHAFGRHSKKVWRAFFVAVPARLFGVITIPIVGALSGAYQVQALGPLLKAVAIYAALGFAWALFIEFQWHQIRAFFTSQKMKASHASS